TAFPANRSEDSSLRFAGNAVPPTEKEARSEDFSRKMDDYDERILQARKGGAEGGQTWMCRKLAIKFAAWLSVEFEDWILETIENVLFGPTKHSHEILRQIALLTNERDEWQQQVAQSIPYQKVHQLERQIRNLKAQVSRAQGQQLSFFKSL
ncbi:MAG TPA: KilA-N domain-containing protein, partial [Hymenobacter sp.]